MNKLWPSALGYPTAVLLALGLMACTTIPDSSDDEAAYMERWQAQQAAALAGGGLPGYDPLEPVSGSLSAAPLPRTKGVIDPAAIDAASAYAAKRSSSSFMVWHDDAIVAESYFGEVDSDTLINAKSMAKPLTAIVIGRAIAQGHIKSLDQPVADFITEWQDDPQRSKIRVRHLLDMRTGLLAQGIPSGPDDPLARAYLHPRHEKVIIEEYPITHEPGSRYEYANVNSELVAPLIERATGQRYGDYVGTHILSAIGAPGGDIWVNRPGGMAHSGCCILLPAQSWLRLAVLLLEDGEWQGQRLLPQGYVQAMRTGTQQNIHAGLGVWLGSPYAERRGSLNMDGLPPELQSSMTFHSEPYKAEDLFLFDGNGHQVVYIVPSLDLIVMRTGTYPPKGLGWDNAKMINQIIGGIPDAKGSP